MIQSAGSVFSRCDSRLRRRRRPAASSRTGHGSARDTQDPRWRPPQPWRSWPSPGKTRGRAGRAPGAGRARPDALDPGFHGVGARWIRGFMAFGRVRDIGTVMLMMPACPESGFLERAARPR